MPENNDTLRALGRSEAQMEALADKLGDLKNAFEEFIDRFDADFEVFRDKMTNFAVVGSVVEDHKKAIPILAARIDERTASLDAKIEERSSARKDEISDLKNSITELRANQSNMAVENAELKSTVKALQQKVYTWSGAAAVISTLATMLINRASGH